MNTTATSADPRHDHFADGAFDSLVEQMQRNYDALVQKGTPLFVTDADDLWEIYLRYFGDPVMRQYHNCSCCKAFIRRYGSLVVVNNLGETEPAFVFETMQPSPYMDSMNAMYERVSKAKIVREFVSDQSCWGTPHSGGFSHFAVKAQRIIKPWGTTPTGERMRTIQFALTEFSAELLDEALRVLDADAVNRAHRFVGPVKWLRGLHDIRNQRNAMWHAVASAPEGFVHPRSSVIGTLLEDIKAGYQFEDVRRRFNAKMHPLSYQRPQAAPSQGTIAQAEKLVAQLGITKSLERRYARIEDVELAWRPTAPVSQDAPVGFGVFDHLKSKGPVVSKMALPPKVMTWEKFLATVLPSADKMQMKVPNRGNFTGLTYAQHPEEPSLFKWDGHTAWFVFSGGSLAHQWNLNGGEYVDVTGIWNRPQGYTGSVLLLAGARYTETRGHGNALFPECLKGELHAVRSVIEAYSRTATLVGATEATACGCDVIGAAIRVGGIDYQIDRLT